MDRGGLRLKLFKAQAEAGDIVLLFADESEALTHPYLARAWAKKDADLRVWGDLKARHLAHRTFADLNNLENAVHHAVAVLNSRRNRDPLDTQRISA